MATDRDTAVGADRIDRLAFVRDRFSVPEGVTYLDGNSLGALPIAAPGAVADAVERQWGNDLITSWNGNGWWTLPRRVGDRIGSLIGAAAGQVICGDSTSIQLFQAVVAAVRLRPGRTTVITDGGGFPTDQYVVDSVGRLLGLHVVRVDPAGLGATLDTLAPGTVAAVALSAVDYRTGELWDVAGLTEQIRRAGAASVWDLSHAAGAIPVRLDEVGADFAVGCGYKYLNGGPGAPGWIYVAEHLQDLADLPLTGWQGHADPFALEPSYRPGPGIERGRIGTPPVLSMLALEAALGVWDGVDLGVLRAKSLRLSQLVIDYADAHLPTVEVVTPRDPSRRGSQVSLRMPHAYEVCQALIARGVIGDFRAPDLLRLGLAALYLSHVEVWDAMDALAAVLDGQEYLRPEFARPPDAAVT